MTLTCHDLNANFYTDSFRAHELFFVAKGHLEVIMEDMDIGLGLKFTTQTLADGRVVPAVESVDVLVDIDRSDIDIKIWGNIWSDFASAFEIFFKSTVVDMIRDGVKSTLETTVPDYINAALAGTDGELDIPVGANWILDWETIEAAVVTETAFEIGAKGILFDSELGEQEWSTDFPDIPYKVETEPAQFQAFLSDLSIDSLLGSYLEVGDVAGWVYGDQLPSKLNSTTLVASDLDIAFPGFSKKYGADAIVDIFGNCTDLHDFTSSAANQDVTVYGSANLQFWPRFNDTTELAVSINVIDIDFTGGIAVDNFEASADISTFLVDKIEVVHSTIGNISAFKLKLELNTVSKILVPSLNKWLQKYQVPIPSNVLGIFTLSNLYLGYQDGYISAGATPTFVAPATTPELEGVSGSTTRFEQF